VSRSDEKLETKSSGGMRRAPMEMPRLIDLKLATLTRSPERPLAQLASSAFGDRVRNACEDFRVWMEVQNRGHRG
jgi:hypothetical protein